MVRDPDGSEYPDRYNQSVALDPGWNTVEVNLEQVAAGKLDPTRREYGRPIDVARARHFVFSVPEEKSKIKLGELRLIMDFIRLEERLEKK